MASPIELDTKRWIKVVPVEDNVITVKALNFGCYYSNAANPPEKASEGTELATNSSLTIEVPSGRWFRAKEPSSTEAPFQPSILQVTPRPAPGGEIVTEELGNEIVTTEKIKNLAVVAGKIGTNQVTEGKIAPEAVTSAKVKPAATPVIAAEKLVTAGGGGGDRIVNFSLTGDGGTTLKYKLKHELKTFAVSVTFQKNETGKPGEPILSPTEKTVPISENEVELTFAAGKPAAAETIWVRIEG